MDYVHLSTRNRIVGGEEVEFSAEGVSNDHFRRRVSAGNATAGCMCPQSHPYCWADVSSCYVSWDSWTSTSTCAGACTSHYHPSPPSPPPPLPPPPPPGSGCVCPGSHPWCDSDGRCYVSWDSWTSTSACAGACTSHTLPPSPPPPSPTIPGPSGFIS
eukprot:1600163-Prymnesium_polylepis.1